MGKFVAVEVFFKSDPEDQNSDEFTRIMGFNTEDWLTITPFGSNPENPDRSFVTSKTSEEGKGLVIKGSPTEIVALLNA